MLTKIEIQLFGKGKKKTVYPDARKIKFLCYVWKIKSRL